MERSPKPKPCTDSPTHDPKVILLNQALRARLRANLAPPKPTAKDEAETNEPPRAALVNEGLVALLTEIRQERELMMIRLGRELKENRILRRDQARLLSLLMRTQQYSDDMERWAASGERLHSARENRSAAALESMALRLEQTQLLCEEIIDSTWMRRKTRERYQARLDGLEP